MIKRKLKKKHHKKKTHKSKNKNFKLLNSLLVIIIALILVIAYILYTYDTQELKKEKSIAKNIQKTIEKEITEVERNTKKELSKYVDTIEIKRDKFEEYTKDLYEEYVDEDIIDNANKKIEKIKDKLVNDSIEKKEALKKEFKEEKKDITKIEKVVQVIDKQKPTLSKLPKLAIVIDDVTTQHQLNKIKKIGYTTTASLMPPTQGHPNSAIIAQDLEFNMIHFPMEASTFRGEEENTLHINDSYQKIEKRVAQIRSWYPNVKYTNNHTGSKFTADEKAMDKFFRALVKYDFTFVDSRTTGKTVAKKMAKKYGMPYIARNVFLDNEKNFKYIQNQLRKAIKIAKKNGYAVAICHPYPITIKVLKQSKHLLEGLELIYLNQLPNLNK